MPDRITEKHSAALSPHVLYLILDLLLQRWSPSGQAYKNWKEFYTQEELKDIVVCGTLAGICAGLVLDHKTYATCLVDEAGQAAEPDVLRLPWRARRIILCCDHQQLPPNSQHPSMRMSLMERLISKPGMPSNVLACQYRMPPEIAAWPSQYFYEDRLQHVKPPTRPQDLPRGFPWPAQRPFAFVNVNGSEVTIGRSRGNNREVTTIRDIVKKMLLDKDNKPTDIGVITPYNGQKHLLQGLLAKDVVVGSIDAFQGNELRIIILSLVHVFA